MALSCIPNQVIEFCTRVNNSEQCGGGDDFRVAVAQNDKTEFEFTTTPASKSVVADFSTACGVNWVCGAGWSINTVSEVASYSGAGAGLLTHTLISPLNTGLYHKLKFDIRPSTTSSASLIPRLGGNNVKQIGFNFLTPGEWQTVEVYYYLNTKTSDVLGFNAGACPAFDIRNVELEEMTTAIPVIEDDDGNVLYTFTPDSATFFPTANVYPTYNIFQIDDAAANNPIEIYYRGPTVLVRFRDWDLFSISYDCVRIRINEGVPSISNSYLSSTKIDYRATHARTLVLSWTCDEPQFGLDYELDFTQYLRISAKLRNPRYPYDDEEQYVNSEGVENSIYAVRLKSWEFVTEYLPEEIHDALSLGLIHTNFSIDDVRMQKEEGDYVPVWNDFFTLAYVSINLRQASPGRLLALRQCNKLGVGGDSVGSTVVL